MPRTRIPFLIERLRQGSENWLEWRRNGIGASDAPAIMGENPWKTPDQVLAEKLGLSSCINVSNSVMDRGSALEPEARRRYEKTFGVRVKPECVKSVTRDWLRASLDGLSHDTRLVLEIKCGESVYKFTASRLRPPRYYYGQLQHILAVTGYDSIDFWCYLPKHDGIHVRVPRNERYIDHLIETEEELWKRVNEVRLERRQKSRPRRTIGWSVF